MWSRQNIQKTQICLDIQTRYPCRAGRTSVGCYVTRVGCQPTERFRGSLGDGNASDLAVAKGPDTVARERTAATLQRTAVAPRFSARGQCSTRYITLGQRFGTVSQILWRPLPAPENDCLSTAGNCYLADRTSDDLAKARRRLQAAGPARPCASFGHLCRLRRCCCCLYCPSQLLSSATDTPPTSRKPWDFSGYLR